MTENIISVIIPVYNVASYLPQCLTSVLQNTYNNLEVICVNDGSTDESPSILQSFAEADTRIRVVTQENRGLAMARNAGMDTATGDFIAFVDSDDWIHPQYFEHLLGLTLRYDADISACRMVDTVFEKKKMLSFSTAGKLEINEKECQIYGPKASILGKGITGGGTPWKLYRADLLEGVRFQNEIKIEDLPFCLEAVCVKEEIRCVYAPLGMYFYCRRKGSLATKLTINDEFQLAVYYYNKGMEAEEKGDDRRAYAFLLHAMKRGILLRYRLRLYPEPKKTCHQLVKACLQEFLELDYPNMYEKVFYLVQGNSPALYLAGHFLRHPGRIRPELAYWKKARLRQKELNRQGK